MACQRSASSHHINMYFGHYASFYLTIFVTIFAETNPIIATLTPTTPKTLSKKHYRILGTVCPLCILFLPSKSSILLLFVWLSFSQPAGSFRPIKLLGICNTRFHFCHCNRALKDGGPSNWSHSSHSRCHCPVSSGQGPSLGVSCDGTSGTAARTTGSAPYETLGAT